MKVSIHAHTSRSIIMVMIPFSLLYNKPFFVNSLNGETCFHSVIPARD